ncbi:MAG: DUF4430 domain-containing protein [Patescibacteria group bacterium]|jgi:hypothetical protein
MRRHLLWIVPLALLILLFALAPLGEITVPVTGNAEITEQPELPNAIATIEYKGEEGKNAFQLLEEQHDVAFEQFDFGVLVNSIDGQEANENHFWLFYVNGEQGQVGADVYETKNDDTVLWRLEESTL